jgi:hypothetical protein
VPSLQIELVILAREHYSSTVEPEQPRANDPIPFQDDMSYRVLNVAGGVIITPPGIKMSYKIEQERN